MKEVDFPDKLYYSIGEVKEITNIEPYVLRYWETEFPSLRPKKNNRGQRTYQKKDIEIILKIKELLYDKKYTIAGAKSVLKGEQEEKETKSKTDEDHIKFLKKIHSELAALQKTIEGSKTNDLFED